ncbi:MAG: AAA family ATPase [Myxococcales bacterium]|nr:AAA family ATPase [Myxococcales bacterium]
MNRFETLRIGGFKRLRDISVKMPALTVLIGANGAGKTSFLEVWSLLASACRGQLASKLSELGGIGEILTRDRADHLFLQLEMSVPDHAPLQYGLVVAPQGAAYQIKLEFLKQQDDPKRPAFKHIESAGPDIRYFDVDQRRLAKIDARAKVVRPNWEHNPLETSLSQVPKMFQQPENFRKRLASSTFYGALQVGPGAPIRMPQPLKPAALPGANGEDLVSCLYSLRESDRDRFSVLEHTLSAAFPDFERLEFPPAAAGVLAATWKDRNFSRPLYLHQLSEGTLRFLWLATLLQSRDLTAVTMIDEPEVSMHPELVRLLVELMREASQRTQLIIATHSDRLVRFLSPEEVLVADLHEGAASLTWASEMDIEHWLAEYSLDQLWAMGNLGGRA